MGSYLENVTLHGRNIAVELDGETVELADHLAEMDQRMDEMKEQFQEHLDAKALKDSLRDELREELREEQRQHEQEAAREMKEFKARTGAMLSAQEAKFKETMRRQMEVMMQLCAGQQQVAAGHTAPPPALPSVPIAPRQRGGLLASLPSPQRA